MILKEEEEKFHITHTEREREMTSSPSSSPLMRKDKRFLVCVVVCWLSLTAAVLPGRALAWGSYTAQFSLLQTTEKKKRRKRNPVEHIGYSLVSSSTCALRDCTHRHTNYSRTSSRANRHVFFFFSLEFLFTTTQRERDRTLKMMIFS